jgi:hypothetical protein
VSWILAEKNNVPGALFSSGQCQPSALREMSFPRMFWKGSGKPVIHYSPSKKFNYGRAISLLKSPGFSQSFRVRKSLQFPYPMHTTCRCTGHYLNLEPNN